MSTRHSISILIATSLMVQACSLFNPEANLSRSMQGTGRGTAGIRNVQAMAMAMSEVTKVPLTQSVRDEGRGQNVVLGDHAQVIAPWLSSDGNIETVNSSMVLSITGFAGMFCKAFLANEAAASASARVLHSAVDFNAGAAGLQSISSADLMNGYARRFWRRDATPAELQTLQDSLSEAVTELSTGTQNSQSAQRALLVPCTVALSSIEFLKS